MSDDLPKTAAYDDYTGICLQAEAQPLLLLADAMRDELLSRLKFVAPFVEAFERDHKEVQRLREMFSYLPEHAREECARRYDAAHPDAEEGTP
jgi:hypothetical protein